MQLKHIFTIHSPITFLMAVSIIRHQKINENDVVIIASNYKIPFQVGKIVEGYEDIYKSMFKKLFHFNLLNQFDQYIAEITSNQPYIAYIDIMHNYQKLLVTNDKCKEFHFFEEGTASYMAPKTIGDFAHTSFTERFRNPTFKDLIQEYKMLSRGFISSIHALPYHPQSYQYGDNRKYFTISNYCYPGVSENQKEVIIPEFSNRELSILSSDIKLENELLIIEETYPKDFKVGDVEYKEILKKSINIINKDAQMKIYLKLRPNKSAERSRLVRLLEELNFNFEVLPSHVLAEGLFLNSKNLKVLGFVSSLLFYAKIFGHQPFTMIHKLKNKPASRFDHINGFKELVNEAK